MTNGPEHIGRPLRQVMAKLDPVKQAAKVWVRADWAFRFGPDCFTHETQVWLVSAERQLRRVVTESADLQRAYDQLKGVK